MCAHSTDQWQWQKDGTVNVIRERHETRSDSLRNGVARLNSQFEEKWYWTVEGESTKDACYVVHP